MIIFLKLFAIISLFLQIKTKSNSELMKNVDLWLVILAISLLSQHDAGILLSVSIIMSKLIRVDNKEG